MSDYTEIKKDKEHKYTKNNRIHVSKSKSLKINHKHKTLINRHKNKFNTNKKNRQGHQSK